MNKKIIAAVLLSAPSLACAHPGHIDNFIAAFAHPFTGIDHLVMMLCVGIFAGRIGGHTRWQLPLTFIAVMFVGWLSGRAGLIVGGIDSGIAAGLIALGVLLAWRAPLSLRLQTTIVAVFALLHGMAHGVELQGSFSVSGFLLATALLHGAGLLIASRVPAHKQICYRVLGIVLSVLGGGLLIST